MDTEKGSTMSAANNVVVRFKDGRMLKGTTRDFLPAKAMFHLYPVGAEEAVEVRVVDLKAVFFVRRLGGDPSYNEYKELPEQRVASYNPSNPGFFLTPVDPKSNNIRVFVVRDSVKEVKLGAQADGIVRGSALK